MYWDVNVDTKQNDDNTICKNLIESEQFDLNFARRVVRCVKSKMQYVCKKWAFFIFRKILVLFLKSYSCETFKLNIKPFSPITPSSSLQNEKIVGEASPHMDQAAKVVLNYGGARDWNVHLPRSKLKKTANLEPHQWITHYDNVDKKSLTMQLHTQEHTHRRAHICGVNTQGLP